MAIPEQLQLFRKIFEKVLSVEIFQNILFLNLLEHILLLLLLLLLFKLLYLINLLIFFDKLSWNALTNWVK